jgi:hypothetical protein
MEHEQAVRSLAVECYLLGEMTPGEREAFEDHYFECAVCGDDVRSAAHFIGDLKETLEAGRVSAGTRVPVRETRESTPARWNWPIWLTPQIAAAAVVVVAALAGVEIISTSRQLSEANAPRIAKYQVLRAQTRGAATVLNAATGAPAVLVFDLPEFSPLLAATGLQFVVKSTDGRQVFQIAGGSFAPGDPVTLSIPKLDLPAGSYILYVETAPAAGKGGQELGQYPFEIKRQ